MYAETRFFDDGSVIAVLHKGFGYPEIVRSDNYDTYVEPIGDSDTRVQTDHDNSSDYKNVREWLQAFDVEFEDFERLVDDLQKGVWVKLT